MTSTTDRQQQMRDWLQTVLQTRRLEIHSASSDASFRHYFRVRHDGASWIVMDAPPRHEDCGPFTDVAQRLQEAGINAPSIHACDMRQGFVLLTDLGERLYLDALNAGSADALYADAIRALVRMQSHVSGQGLPDYDRRMLRREMSLFPEWLLARHLGLRPDPQRQEMLDGVFMLLEDNALEQPQLFVHRDYHSRNLMVVEENNPGVIDFQDAVNGPITYDLVSLLRDCYIRWPEQQVTRWRDLYLELAAETGLLAGIDRQQFVRWFDLMGIQRHLKASGIFARLLHRDGKPGYVGDIPRTLAYVADACKGYPELQTFGRFIERVVLAALQGAGQEQ